MRVLMISLDRGLVRRGSSGDVRERHKRYADLAGRLDIIVFAANGEVKTDNNLRVMPTVSSKLLHFSKALGIARKLLREQKYDLLVTQEFAAPVGTKLKKEFGVPWIVNVHSMFFSSQWLKLNPVNWYLSFRIKKSIQNANGFRVNNEAIKQKLDDWGIKVPILVQPTPVDVTKFWITDKPENPVPKILYVGRLSSEKNVKMLIESVLAVPTGALLIAGEGGEEQILRKAAAGSSRITFLGPKTHQELMEIYRRSDIFVLPSDTESFGKVLIEAAAARCALVATKTAGAMNILTDQKTGILIPVGDKQSLVDVLLLLTADKELRGRLAAAAQDLASAYDAQKASEKTVSFWKEIVKV